ncbi:hypothetical protein ELS19_18515 [Halogeometricum borinquense]|uniref:Uncharacterized protein n=1 Tax=Halogeometricum borinquense TaxID=60847 RepID=A0A482SZF8_9EURY|nr:hypothetical protein [Halogeometricum borinquense]RYJ08511.1 hypothetical protein ELS19_18515 [Halogeometricum borinquense]
MKRRTFITGAVGVGVIAVGGTSAAYVFDQSKENSKEKVAKDVPESVEEVKPLAEAFHKRISPHFDDVRVFISRDGEIVMEYTTNTKSQSALNTEFSQIAAEYADVAADYKPTTLSMVTGPVQGIVPVSSLKAYLRDDINKKAFLQTIQVTDVERNNNR